MPNQIKISNNEGNVRLNWMMSEKMVRIEEGIFWELSGELLNRI